MPKTSVTVQLTTEDGNAFMIMGRVQASMRRAGVPNEQVQEYLKEAAGGDYDNLLRVTREWVNVR